MAGRRSGDRTIEDLLRSERLQQIEADFDEAAEMLQSAETHLESAAMLAESDPAAAYQLAYDAARKATSADMLAEGYRTKADKPGAHAAVVIYAEEALVGAANANALSNFDQMRRQRNRTECGASVVGAQQLSADIANASEIVAGVRRRFKERSQSRRDR